MPAPGAPPEVRPSVCCARSAGVALRSGVAPGVVYWDAMTVFTVLPVFFLAQVCNLHYTFFCLFCGVFSLFRYSFFRGAYLLEITGFRGVPRGTGY